MDIGSILNQLKLLIASLTATTIILNFNPLPVISVSPVSSQPPTNMMQMDIGVSRNWSGYVADNGTFTSVEGTWMVPQINKDDQPGADATWVGIGGVMSHDLIQSGTQNVADGSGGVISSAFIETLPFPSQAIPVSIKGGDSVSSSISRQENGNWKISFRNNTTGQSYETIVSYNSSLSSAEWIEEAPSTGRRQLPLDNFGTVKFENGTAIKDGTTTPMNQLSLKPIVMTNFIGEPLVNTSDNENDFTITRSSANTIPDFSSQFFGTGRHRMRIGSGMDF